MFTQLKSSFSVITPPQCQISPNSVSPQQSVSPPQFSTIFIFNFRSTGTRAKLDISHLRDRDLL